MKGLVIKNTGSWYTVLTDEGLTVECKIKGNFRLKGIRSTNPVAVGDRVQILCNQEGTAFITSIDDRRNYIIRKASNLSKQSHILAANVDQAMLVVTVNRPQTSTTFIDRFLASAEAYSVPVVLLFNKTDLLNDDEKQLQEAMMQLYGAIGYECRAISAETGEGVEALRPLLQGKITLLSGNSGVGKSTLINRLIPDAKLRTAEISESHNTGMHTTTFSEMLRLPPSPSKGRMGGGFNRHSRHKRLRHLRHGSRGTHELFPRDFPFLEGMSVLELHAYARARLCRAESTRRAVDCTESLPVVPLDDGRQG